MLDTVIKFQFLFGGISLNGEYMESKNPPNNDDWKKAKRLIVLLKGFTF